MKKIIAVVALCMLSSNAFAAVEIGAQAIFGKTSKSTAVNVKNSEDKPMLIHVRVEKEKKYPVPEGAGDCTDTLRPFPKMFVLKPGDSQDVKFISRKAGYCRVRFIPTKVNPDMVMGTEDGGATVIFTFRPSIPAVITD